MAERVQGVNCGGIGAVHLVGQRLGFVEDIDQLYLRQRPRSDAAKLNLAARLRLETTLTIRQIADRMHMGSWKSLNNKLYLRCRGIGMRNKV